MGKVVGNTRRAWEGSMEAIVSLAAVFVPALLVFGIVYLVELVRL